MKETFILGAGFSYSYSKEFPLAPNVIEIFFKNKKKNDHIDKMMIKYIKDYFGRLKNVNFETVLTFLSNSPSILHSESDILNQNLYNRLIRYICIILENARIKNKQVENMNDTILMKFAQYLIKNSSNVLSFNYDLILENFLIHTNHWLPTTGYGPNINLPPHLVPNSNQVSFTSLLNFDSKIHLYKLHGSINFCKPLINYPGSFDQIFIAPFISINGEIKEISSIDRNYIKHKFTKYEYMPYIIPPIFGKSLNSDLIKDIWHRALTSIHLAQIITIIGYSFPESDILAERIFRETQFTKGLTNTKRKVRIVDPKLSNDSKNRIKDIFRTSSVEFFEEDAMSFLNRTIDAVV